MAYLRKRRANLAAPGVKRVRKAITMSVTEFEILSAAAEQSGMTLQAYVMDCALNANSEYTGEQRRHILEEVNKIHWLCANIANNVNQLAHWANATQQFPNEAEEITERVRNVLLFAERANEIHNEVVEAGQ